MFVGLIQIARTCLFCRTVHSATIERLASAMGLVVFLVAGFGSLAPAASDNLLGNGSFPLATGDSLGITVYGEADLSGEFEVDSLGLISLPLIGRVRVTGLDTSELEAVIVEKLKDGYMKNPWVTVEVRLRCMTRPSRCMVTACRDAQTPFKH